MKIIFAQMKASADDGRGPHKALANPRRLMIACSLSNLFCTVPDRAHPQGSL